MALEPVPLDSYCAWWWSLLLISLSVYCMSVMDSPDGTRTCSPGLLLCLVVESTSDLHGDGPPLVQALSVRLSVHRHPRNEVLGRQLPPTTNTNSYNYLLSYFTSFFLFLIFIFIYIYLFFCFFKSIYLSIYLYLPTYLPIYLSIYLSISISISISIYIYIYIYIYPQSLKASLATCAL